MEEKNYKLVVHVGTSHQSETEEVKVTSLKMQNVELYSKNNDYQKSASRKFFNYFGDFLKTEFKNQEISLLDVGSGCGRILSEVTIGESELKFSKVVGVDKSEKMVNYSNVTYGNKQVSFQYFDAMEKIPDDLLSEKFDFVTSFNCLHHLIDMKKGLESINDLMAVNGVFGGIIFVWHRFLDAWDALIEQYPIMTNWRDHFTPLFSAENPDEEIKKYLIESGFEIVEFIDVKNEVYDSLLPEHFAKIFDAVNPFFTKMSEEQQQQFSKDQINKIFELQGNNSLIEPFRNIYFVVRKVKARSTDSIISSVASRV